MALRDILTKEDPILRKHSREVTDFGKKTSDLIDDLLETVVKAEGLGLAAPQVGVLRRAVVVYDGEKFVALVNPQIVEQSGSVTRSEACLSCPGESGIVVRPQKVTVRALDRDGQSFEMTCEDMAARAVCHELDHLDGVLFIDVAKEITEDENEEGIAEEELPDLR